MAANLGTLRVFLEGKTTHFDRNFGRANTTLARTGALASTTGTKVGGLAAALGRIALPIGLAVALGGARASFADLEEGMTRSLAIMGDVEHSMRVRMTDAAVAMSTATTFSAREVADAYFFLASAGLNAEQSLAALSTVTNFAQAGYFDMALATDLLTDAQSALGLTVKNTTENMQNMNRIGNILVKANTLANATVQQFSEALTNEAGAAIKNFNVDLEEGVAVLAAYADQGVKGNVAGSMFSRMLRLLQQSVLKNEDAFKRYNVTVFNTRGELRDVSDIVRDMEKAFRGMSTEQRAAALDQLGFKARVQQAILPLIGASEKIKDYRDGLEDAGNIMNEVAEKNLDSINAQMRIFGNNLAAVGAHFGKFVGFKDTLKFINFFFQRMNQSGGERRTLPEAFMPHSVKVEQLRLDMAVQRIEALKRERKERQRVLNEREERQMAHVQRKRFKMSEEQEEKMRKELMARRDAWERLRQLRFEARMEEGTAEEKLDLLYAKRLQVQQKLVDAKGAENVELQIELHHLDERFRKIMREKRMNLADQRGRFAAALEIGSAGAASAVRRHQRESALSARTVADSSKETAANTKELTSLQKELNKIMFMRALDEGWEVIDIAG